MSVAFVKPNEILAPYIERYWMFDNADSPASFMPQIPPGVGLDMFVHYAGSFTTENGTTLPHAHIVFSGQNSCKIFSVSNVHFIAIRFRAGALRNFTDIPLCQLLDANPAVEDIWGVSGKNLVARITGIEEKDETINQLELFLEKKLNENHKDTTAWNVIIQKLYRHYDSVTIDGVSKKMNISNRHFRRRFTEETGFAPKHFQQLARFHATIKPLLLNRERAYLPTALGNGYFDQTHFIKEFKYFMNCTPSAFLQDNNFMSHFYYPSLNGQGNFVKK